MGPPRCLGERRRGRRRPARPHRLASSSGSTAPAGAGRAAARTARRRSGPVPAAEGSRSAQWSGGRGPRRLRRPRAGRGCRAACGTCPSRVDQQVAGGPETTYPLHPAAARREGSLSAEHGQSHGSSLGGPGWSDRLDVMYLDVKILLPPGVPAFDTSAGHGKMERGPTDSSRRPRMASQDSFGAKSTLDVGDQAYEIYRLSSVTGDGLDVESLPFSLKVLLENLLRTEDGADITADHIKARRRMGRGRRAGQGDPVHAGARAHAGLHRRAVHRRPRHHARGDGRPRRRRRPRSTRSPRPRWSSTTPSSPTSSAPPRRSSATSRSSTSATASATSSCAGARTPSRLQGRPARHRHRAPGQHRAPRPRGLHPRDRRRADGVPGHLRRHRLPHHDGQRHRRGRLGRRRHRGRGRDARSAGSACSSRAWSASS